MKKNINRKYQDRRNSVQKVSIDMRSHSSNWELSLGLQHDWRHTLSDTDNWFDLPCMFVDEHWLSVSQATLSKGSGRPRTKSCNSSLSDSSDLEEHCSTFIKPLQSEPCTIICLCHQRFHKASTLCCLLSMMLCLLLSPRPLGPVLKAPNVFILVKSFLFLLNTNYIR